MTDYKTYIFDFNDLKLTTSDIEKALGYKEGEDRILVTELIEEILYKSGRITNIKAEYRVFDSVLFDKDTKSLKLNDLNFQIKKVVFSQIKSSDSLAVFLCTAGSEIGERSRLEMKERDLLKGYIFDVIGSEIVEAATDLMQDDLKTDMGRAGKKITNRYSPGYCGWDVAEQHKIFKLMPDNWCNIRLTPSALMDPVKSVSGIIGIGKNVRYNRYTCGMCEMKDCIYRNIR